MKRLLCSFAAALLLLATACVSIAGGPGGWKMARLIINLARVSEEGVHNVPCQVQVEVPERNFLGVIDDALAEEAAAEAADTAAELVMPQGLVSAS